MNPPIAVMFDWCNTLVGSSSVNRTLLNETLKSLGRPDIDISHVSDGNIIKYLSYCFGDDWKTAMKKIQDIPPISEIYPNDNVHELLELLHKNNIKMGIVSNKEGHKLRKEVETLGLSKYFTVILGAGDTPETKPSPKPIIAALELMDIPPSKLVFFVGDSDSDVESATKARCCPIAYNNFTNKDVLSFTNFGDFGSFIESLLSRV